MEIRFQKIVRANLSMQRIMEILIRSMDVARGQKTFGNNALYVVKTKWMMMVMMIQRGLLICHYRTYMYKYSVEICKTKFDDMC